MGSGVEDDDLFATQATVVQTGSTAEGLVSQSGGPQCGGARTSVRASPSALRQRNCFETVAE